jgi:hypothetical protein
MRIWSNPSRHCWATTLSSSHRTKVSRTDSSLGGGSPTNIAAAGEALGAGAPLDAVPIAVEDRPSRLPVVSFPRFVSTMVSGQIGFLSSCRLCRKKHCRKRCTVARVLVPSSRWPWCSGGSVRPDKAEVKGKLLSHRFLNGRSRLEWK